MLLRPHGGHTPAGERLDGRRRVGEVEFYDRQVHEVLAQTRAAGSLIGLQPSERRLVVGVEMSESLFADTVASPAEAKREIESEILARLGIESEVQFMQRPAPP